MNSLDILAINTTTELLNQYTSPYMRQVLERYNTLIRMTRVALRRLLNSYHYDNEALYVSKPEPSWCKEHQELVNMLIVMEIGNPDVGNNLYYHRVYIPRQQSTQFLNITTHFTNWFNMTHKIVINKIQSLIEGQYTRFGEQLIDNDTQEKVRNLAINDETEFEAMVNAIREQVGH